VWVAALLLLSTLLAGCEATAGDSTPRANGSPTTTQTPAREIIVIDGEPVIEVFIPDPSQNPTYALTATALYRRQSGRWERTRTDNDGRALLIDPADPERIYRGNHPPCTVDGTTTEIPFEVSHDGGLSWRVQPQGRNIRPLAIDPSIPEIIYGSSCYLAISTTSGNTWMRLALMEDFPLADVAFAGEQLLILGTSKDGVSRLRKVDITDPAEPLLGDMLLEVRGHATLDARGDRIVVGGVDSVHVSDDGGATWASSRFGLETVTSSSVPAPGRAADPELADIGVHTVRVGITDRQRIYAGTSHGLYISQDGGATWVRYDEIAIDDVVTDIQFALDGADLFVTTDRGVLSVPNP
jgi:photosystem II stability/assembly factor-like uncharacterized protein